MNIEHKELKGTTGFLGLDGMTRGHGFLCGALLVALLYTIVLGSLVF